MLKKEKLVLKNIVLAQVASDAAKAYGHPPIQTPGWQNACKGGYDAKARHIEIALSLLTNMPRCGINFFMEAKPDQNGHPSFITYFEVKIKNKRRQISFHTPSNKGQAIAPYVGKGRKTRWTKVPDGSYYDCIAIAKYLEEVSAM